LKLDRPEGNGTVGTFKRGIPYLLVVVLLACTVGVWWFWSHTAARRERDRFEAQVTRITGAIADRLTSYSMLLEAGAALFAASEDVTREEWRDFYEYRRARTDFPGLLHVVYAPLLPRSGLAEHERKVRASGLASYSVWPEVGGEAVAPVLFLEPYDAGARRALGFNLLSEAVRRQALEKARDTGRVVLGGVISLVSQENPRRRDGCILFVPVYRPGSSLDTVEQRRAALRGFIFSPFRLSDFLDSLFQGEPSDIAFQLYDGPRVDAQDLIYDGSSLRGPVVPSSRPLLRESRTLAFYDHPWTLDFQSTPVFEASADRWTANGILVAGGVISLLTFLFVRSLEHTQERAVALAGEMTAALTENERKFRAVTESAQDAILIVDDQGRVAYWNLAATQTFGYSKAEILGQQAIPLIAAEPYRQGLQQAFLELAGTGTSSKSGRTRELAGLRKTGEEFPVEISVSAIPVEERWHIVVIVRDISERRRGEAERVAREAAEEASRAKSGFVANMSHEIRTPLNAILGFTQVLERDPDLTTRQSEHVRTISRSGRHLLHLINDILDMSRIEAGRVTVNPAPFCLHDLLDDLTLMFRSRAEAKGLHLLEERDPSVPRSVVADEGKLRQIFINLLGNAVKFTSQGGVAVRVRAGQDPERLGGLRLVAEVEDSGPGIPDADLERIFDPFNQGEAGVKAGGTGLGLAISRRFIDMLGGSMSLTSRVGHGSCFRFEVPVAPAADPGERERPVPKRVVGIEPGLGPYRILVVDDIQTNRSLLTAILRPLGFEVREAGDGEEALEVYRQWSPSAVLMDMRMPVMDGYEATRRIRAAETGRHTPIIAVTASAFDDLRDQVMAVGVDIYLRKPFRSDELLEALEQCLGLRYVVEGRPAAAPQGAPLTVPKDVARDLRQAVAEGDMGRLAELLTRVPDGSTARSLKTLADRYDYEQILEFLGPAEGGS